MESILNLDSDNLEKELNEFSIQHRIILKKEFETKIKFLKLIEFLKYEIINRKQELTNAIKLLEDDNIKEIEKELIFYLENYPFGNLERYLKYKEFGKNYYEIKEDSVFNQEEINNINKFLN